MPKYQVTMTRLCHVTYRAEIEATTERDAISKINTGDVSWSLPEIGEDYSEKDNGKYTIDGEEVWPEDY